MKTERRPVLPLLLFLLVALSFPVVRLTARTDSALEPQASCNRTAWQTIGPERIGQEQAHYTTVWKEPGQVAFFFQGKMAIDADGSPRAYHPDNIGLEDNSNGKDENGNWVGVVVVHGQPHRQGPGDPYPGYYVSQTSLRDRTILQDTNPRKYVDSEAIPYIALPSKTAYGEGLCVHDGKACLGDMAFVVNSKNGKSAFAIVADIGPGRKIGEASIALAKALGIPSSPRTGGTDDGIYYLVFPGSGNEKPRTLEEINTIGAERLGQWGGKARLNACLSSSGGGGNHTGGLSPEALQRVKSYFETQMGSRYMEKNCQSVSYAGWEGLPLQQCTYDVKGANDSARKTARIILLDASPEQLARWVVSTCMVVTGGAEPRCTGTLSRHIVGQSGAQFPVAGIVFEDILPGDGRFEVYAFRSGVTVRVNGVTHRGTSQPTDAEIEKSLNGQPVSAGQYARIQSTTRQQYWDNGGTKDVTGLLWLDVVRDLYKAAWGSDRNELMIAWARANADSLR